MSIVPARFETSDGHFTVRRAWPRRNGTLTIEATDDADRLRAGAISKGKPTMEQYGHDSALPLLVELLRASACEAPRLLVHRHRRRAVLHTRGSEGERYTKVLPAGTAEQVASVSERMRRHGAGAGVVVPEVLDASAEHVTFAPLKGSSFHDIGASADAGLWTAAWTSWSQLWPQLVTTSNDDQLEIYSAEDEVNTLNRWVEYLVSYHLSEIPVAKVHELASAVEAALLQEPAGRLGLSHRDLHDKQLFYSSSSQALGLLDCDTAVIAELALDVANLNVHMDLRRWQGHISAETYTTAHRSIAEVKRSLDLDPERTAAYELSTRLRLACLYAFRPGREALAHRWLSQMVRCLDEKTLMRL